MRFVEEEKFPNGNGWKFSDCDWGNLGSAEPRDIILPLKIAAISSNLKLSHALPPSPMQLWSTCTVHATVGLQDTSNSGIMICVSGQWPWLLVSSRTIS